MTELDQVQTKTRTNLFLDQINAQWRAITVIIAVLGVGLLLGRFTSLPKRVDILEESQKIFEQRMQTNERSMDNLNKQVNRLICATLAESEARSSIGC